MIHHWQDIRGLPKPIGPLERGSHGRALRGRTPACQGVQCLPKEQGGDEPSHGTITASSHSGGEMGEYFDGLHHRVAHGTGQGLYICRC